MKTQLRAVEQAIDTEATLEYQVSQLQQMIKNPPFSAIRAMVTPELAGWVLDNLNTRNRNPKAKVLNLLKKHGYRYIGGTLIFGTGGGLLDGQNRLIHCRNSQEPMDILMVFGVLDNNFTLIDSGSKRSAADAFTAALKESGEKHPGIIAEAVRWIENLRTYYDELKENPDSPFPRDSSDNMDRWSYYQSKVKKDWIRVCAGIAAKQARKKIPASHMAAVLYLYHEAGRWGDATKFREDLERNGQRGPGARLINKIRDYKAAGHRKQEIQSIAWIIQAINNEDRINWRMEQVFPEI